MHREKKLYVGEEGMGYFLAWRKINGKVIFLFLNRMRNMCVCMQCIFSRIYYEGKSIFESCEALLIFGSFGITQGKWKKTDRENLFLHEYIFYELVKWMDGFGTPRRMLVRDLESVMLGNKKYNKEGHNKKLWCRYDRDDYAIKR